MALITKVRAFLEKWDKALASTSAPLSTRISASSGQPYTAASSGRRMGGFASALGPTSVLTGSLDQIRARCRDEIRNNPYAASAADNFEAQTVGNGIFPHWNLDNKPLKEEIEDKFDRWAKRTQFYVKQATAAREIFEGGEVFLRFLSRPSSWKLPVPLDIELIEGEQVPVFLNSSPGSSLPDGQKGATAHSIVTGIELDTFNRKVAYHMYRTHPGEIGLGLFPQNGFSYVRVPATDILHAFKPLRAGLMRGVPHLSSVLVLLHEIGKYTDAAIVKKQIQTMFAGFIEKVDPVGDILPPDTSAETATESSASTGGTGSLEYGIQNSKIETGTMQVLFPGEKITFPSLPQDNDIETFLSVCLHQFAAGIGATYEQITGDLRQVNLSSIRYGVQVMQRKCMAFQQNVLVTQLLEPVVARWIQEAVLSGELVLPFYARKPEMYADITWGYPGWPYMSPKEDIDAAEARIRAGLSSREKEAAAIGEDAATIDKQQVIDNKRADEMGLVYDSDGRKAQKGVKLTASGEEDAGGVSGIKPKDSETPSETAKLSPKPPPPVIAPTAPKPKPNGHAGRM